MTASGAFRLAPVRSARAARGDTSEISTWLFKIIE
jgi:hypothetical protein